ncbi:RNA-dependent RNA polymerase [Vigna angularis]|uniref:RNA-dependent RNA polymerase n=1 Tax=Phaseolus angularis TaxID=3914 RepID=A0A8T0JLV7_PHAAN|nr:RNA-dependent RNA polymerase [Vigna angularis]
MEIDGFEKYTASASEYKNMYDFKLENLMDYYGIETEAEIISGNILKMAKSFSERKDLEGINHAVMSLRKEARSWFNVMIKNKSNSQADDDAYAIACLVPYKERQNQTENFYHESLEITKIDSTITVFLPFVDNSALSKELNM